MKFFKVMLVIALAFAFSAAAYAETQSVKISGDIGVDAFARNQYNQTTNSGVAGQSAGSTTTSNTWQTFIQQSVEVQVDADLTDNVSACIRLVNQRVWGNGNETVNNTDYTIGGVNQRTNISSNDWEIGVDLAYIELKEFLYSPLTLKIGRQDLWFGKGFIVGANRQNGTLAAPEYTVINSFDAVRATLDYDPWTIDAVYAKIDENSVRADDDQNLFGVNVGYVFDQYNGEAEVYWWMQQSRFPNITGNKNEIDQTTHIVGGRGSFDPIEDWTIALEGAYEFGYGGVEAGGSRRDLNAWALDAEIECRYWQDDFAWRPVVAAEYIFYSGDDGDATGETTGWFAPYRGKYDTAIREWQGVYYSVGSGVNNAGNTNQHQILVRGTIEPTDSLTVEALYGHFWLAKSVDNTNGGVSGVDKGGKSLGDEVDVKLTWDYTEDVQFGLLGAWFFPSTNHYEGNSDKIVTDIVGSVKLSF